MLIFFKLYAVYFSIGRLGIKILAFSLSNCTANVWAFWIFFACVYVYSHVWRQACKCMCTCVYVHVETKGYLRVSLSVVLCVICWVKAPLPSEFTKLIYSLTSSGDLSLFPECWDFSQTYTPTVRVEAWDLKAGPHIMDQPLYPQSHHLRNLAALWRSKLQPKFLNFSWTSFCSLLLVIYKMWVFSVQINA